MKKKRSQIPKAAQLRGVPVSGEPGYEEFECSYIASYINWRATETSLVPTNYG